MSDERDLEELSRVLEQQPRVTHCEYCHQPLPVPNPQWAPGVKHYLPYGWGWYHKECDRLEWLRRRLTT